MKTILPGNSYEPGGNNSLIPSQTIMSQQRKSWSRRRKLVVGLVGIIVIIALAVGLGVGLTRQGSDDDESTSSPSPTPIPPTTNNTDQAGIWHPSPGMTWNYEINGALSDSSNQQGFEVWDIDLFDNDEDVISSLQGQGAKVICYFSAGSYEEWRSDAGEFSQSDLGSELDGWPGERWLNVSSQAVRDIMLTRIDLAAQKSCNGVEPDNVDGYNNDNGLDLTQQDAANYIEFLSDAAHQRNLSIGLKNAAEIVSTVVGIVDYCVNEECVKYNECSTFAPFIQQGKAVFHVEYPKGSDTNNALAVSSSTRAEVCDASGTAQFSTILKNMELDSWIETC